MTDGNEEFTLTAAEAAALREGFKYCPRCRTEMVDREAYDDPGNRYRIREDVVLEIDRGADQERHDEEAEIDEIPDRILEIPPREEREED